MLPDSRAREHVEHAGSAFCLDRLTMLPTLLPALLQGAAPSILKAAPSAAVTFAMYDLVIKLITSKAGASARKPTSAHQHKAAAAAGGSAGGKQQQQQQAPATT